eukprot:CAMPEP_0197683198 /NCGR_PEP_ID=MMETSP1338-20131121/97566_1 /TAXON_ID=43686 ORGANISM="Pelagodinium beii, Strain RCC1491" /NCGR_SAMPLE_ID=MMETSP1338 /ASSEMBLY_ACC=CAM_ASM_000754 /LENGTH=128 /DNA_ID=CAMNT_0043264747 /DNA_START=102 /DNA_END=488 /DNA_ORIENTATION=-
MWNVSEPKHLQCNEMTSESDMLHRALRWLRADCLADFATHEELVAPGAAMSGASGAEEVLAFKRHWLTEKVNYDVDAILDVDFKNRVVAASFTSLIPGKEGRGTEFMQFDEELRISGVSAIRHRHVSS